MLKCCKSQLATRFCFMWPWEFFTNITLFLCNIVCLPFSHFIHPSSAKNEKLVTFRNIAQRDLFWLKKRLLNQGLLKAEYKAAKLQLWRTGSCLEILCLWPNCHKCLLFHWLNWHFTRAEQDSFFHTFLFRHKEKTLLAALM